jgi:hypothetical protein
VLPQGESVFTFYRGYNTDTPGWMGISTAQGRATWGNTIKIIVLAVDVIAICPIDNHMITDIINKGGDGEIPVPAIDLTAIGVELAKDDSMWEIFGKVLDKLGEKWDEFAHWIYQSFPADKTTQILRNGKKAFDAFSDLVKKAADVLKVVGIVNEALPFVCDLIFAPEQLKYHVKNVNGNLVEIDAFANPIAHFCFNPELPKVNEEVAFNASASYDDKTPKDELEFRWDFECDGTFDTNWLSYPDATHAYSNAGPHCVKLEVKDGDGLKGKLVKVIYVTAINAGGTCNHIKLFSNRDPWDSTALQDMLEENGFTEGVGENQYEYFESWQMPDVIMSPGTDLVVIVNDQDQTFYNDLYTSLERFERFVENGGTIFWGACDIGWGLGSMKDAGIETLPGGVTFEEDIDSYNYIELPEHPVLQGLPNQLYGYYASHEYFGDLVGGTLVYTVNSSDEPTLIEYEYGDGHMIITGQPLEHGWRYSYDIGDILPRLVRFILGLDPQGKEGAAVHKPVFTGDVIPSN